MAAIITSIKKLFTGSGYLTGVEPLRLLSGSFFRFFPIFVSTGLSSGIGAKQLILPLFVELLLLYSIQFGDTGALLFDSLGDLSLQIGYDHVHFVFRLDHR